MFISIFIVLIDLTLNTVQASIIVRNGNNFVLMRITPPQPPDKREREKKVQMPHLNMRVHGVYYSFTFKSDMMT